MRFLTLCTVFLAVRSGTRISDDLLGVERRVLSVAVLKDFKIMKRGMQRGRVSPYPFY